MAKYSVSASITSPPTNVALQVNGKDIKIQRDASGAWAGNATLTLPNSFPIVFGAVGTPSAPWTLEVKITTPTPESKQVADYKHTDKIPGNLLSILHDIISLTGSGAGI